jgi:Cu+-exporting ATPase
MTATLPKFEESPALLKREVAYLQVGGMSCAGCAASVTRTLNQLTGVELADVNFATRQARVVFAPDCVAVSELVTAIRDNGFDAEPLAQPNDLSQLDQAERQEVEAARDRLLLAAIPAAILMGIMIYCIVRQMPHNQHHHLLTLFLAFPVVFVAGWPTHRASWSAIRRGAPNMDVLISLGTLPTYLAGLIGVPEVTVFVEVAAMVMAFHLFSRYLEKRARGQASLAMRQLANLQVREAHLQRRGETEGTVEVVDVPIEAVQVGDRLLVRPGEAIPTDGRVVGGRSSVNEAIATGEAMPVDKQVGDDAIGGTLNQEGLLEIEVTHTGSDTFLAQMIRLVQEAQSSKVPVQQLADRLTGYFVPSVIGLAASTFAIWYWAADRLHPWIHVIAAELPWVNTHLSPLSLAAFNTIAVLVVACPCALGLATPAALMVGSGRGAAAGILIRNGEAIQTLKSVTTILLDKTGTLTVGQPQIATILPADRSEEVLYWAAAVEQGSEHPLARAIAQRAAASGLTLPALERFDGVPGRGVTARVRGRLVVVGNASFLKERVDTHDADTLDGWQAQIEQLEAEGQTAIAVAVDRQILGLIALSDTLKPDTVATVTRLRQAGYQPAMVTGDNPRAAGAIATQVGIEIVHSEVLPGDKVNIVRQLQERGEVVAMVGDGINDAPALKQADVGIALGTGTDIAIATADIAIVGGNLTALLGAIALSRATFRKIEQNLWWAYSYNLIALPIAAAGLLHPIMAEIAMALSSLNVVWNSLQLRNINLDMP